MWASVGLAAERGVRRLLVSIELGLSAEATVDAKTYRTQMHEARALSKARDRNGALKIVERLVAEGVLSAELYVRRGDYIQLVDDEQFANLTLDTVGASYGTARMIDPASGEALIESGYFHYAIRDQADEGLQYFEDAERLARETLRK